MNIDDYMVYMDSDCISQDFDDIDLYGEIMEESDDNFGNEIEFE